MSSRSSLRLSTLVAMGLSLGASAARAGTYQVYDMYDFDQRRSDLPNNGSMWCGPTSMYNVVYYVASHGYPVLINSPGDPGNGIMVNSFYAGISQRLNWIGDLCGTDPKKGGGSCTAAAQEIYDLYDSDGEVVAFVPSTTSANRFQKLQDWQEAGGVSTLLYGRYKTMSEVLELDPGTDMYDYYKDQYKRTGGHFVTIDGISDVSPDYANGQIVSFRDPAGDEGSGDPNRLTMQSPYMSVERHIHDVKTYSFYTDSCSPEDKNVLPIGNLPSTPEDTLALWEAFTVTVPQFGLTNVNTTGVDDGILFDAPGYDPMGSSDDGNGFTLNLPDSIELDMGTILDARFDQNRFSVDFIVVGDPTLYTVDPRTGRPEVEAKLPSSPVALEVANTLGSRLVLDEDGYLTLIDDAGKARAEVRFEHPMDAVTWLQDTRQIVVAGSRSLELLDADLRSISRVEAALPEGTGRLTVAVDPVTHEIYVMRDGNPRVARFLPTDEGQLKSLGELSLQDARAPRTLEVSRGGRILVSDGGVLVSYDLSGRRSERTRWDGLPAGDFFHLLRSYETPADMATEQEDALNIPAEELEVDPTGK